MEPPIENEYSAVIFALSPASVAGFALNGKNSGIDHCSIHGINDQNTFSLRFHSPDSYLLKGSGILLILAAFTIIRLRWSYRGALEIRVETAASFQKPGREQNQGLLWEEDQLGG